MNPAAARLLCRCELSMAGVSRMRTTLALVALLLACTATAAARAEKAACWQTLVAADEDGDGVVTLEEAANGLDRGFRLIDVNGDGEITAKEHRNCLLDAEDLAAATVLPRRTQKRFAEIDANADGSVALGEFVAAAEAAYAEAAEGGPEALLGRYAAFVGEQGSGSPDVNGDEVVSRMEAALDVLRAFTVMDVDGDRGVSRLEWATVTERPKFTRSFAAIDRNGDKRITRAELLAAGMSDGPVTVWRHAARSFMPDAGTAELGDDGIAAGGSIEP